MGKGTIGKIFGLDEGSAERAAKKERERIEKEQEAEDRKLQEKSLEELEGLGHQRLRRKKQVSNLRLGSNVTGSGNP